MIKARKRCFEVKNTKMKILLWNIREEKGLTLDKLADMSGVSRSTLQRIENSEVSPTMNTMEKLAKALNIRISDLYESKYK